MAGHGSFNVFFRALLAFVLVISLCCSSDSARPIYEPASQRFRLPSFSRGVRGAGFRFPKLPRGPVPPSGPSTGVFLPSAPPPPTLFSSFSHGVDGAHRFPMLPRGPVPPSGPSKGEFQPPPPPLLPPNSLS